MFTYLTILSWLIVVTFFVAARHLGEVRAWVPLLAVAYLIWRHFFST
jgi:hypothetical protein